MLQVAHNRDHGRMGVYDELFPSHQSPAFVQTLWSEGAHGIAGGFEYAARHLTEHRNEFGATIDQVGLAVFFLQRRRVKVAGGTIGSAAHRSENPPACHHSRLSPCGDLHGRALPTSATHDRGAIALILPERKKTRKPRDM